MLRLLTFLLPFLLITLSASHPSDAFARDNRNKCDKNAVFTLHDINYSSYIIYSTPAHLAVAQGHIEFNLTNTDVPYTTHCSAYSSQVFNFFYGNIVYQCDAPTGEGVTAASSANFTFSEPDGVFNVNQTWSCSQHRKTVNLLGVGSGKATLSCQTTTWTNPNWVIGEIYSNTSTTCKPAELQITPKVTKIN
ncbi:hypothetical protein AOQ84DRAFT_215440 [Glonium stellatum]|uniref:AA1-like domain-containing protein n=1 Tax=Glonium stellatum TaxID=574774 RepID=A0A8E2F4V6_9PEZI|nr:hypothetical protein AOQ84DRAFT_215440 [Glonium stellatum]